MKKVCLIALCLAGLFVVHSQSPYHDNTAGQVGDGTVDTNIQFDSRPGILVEHGAPTHEFKVGRQLADSEIFKGSRSMADTVIEEGDTKGFPQPMSKQSKEAIEKLMSKTWDTSYKNDEDYVILPGGTVEQILAQIDSAHRVDSIIRVKADSSAEALAPAHTTIGPFDLPAWLPILVAALIASLSAAQFILKRIPTAASVKIQGILGVILDVLTFFQPDKSNKIRSTAPPAVQNGIEKPQLKDYADHTIIPASQWPGEQ